MNCVNDYDPQIIVVSWTFPDSVAVVRLAQEQRKPVVVITQGSDIHIYLRMPCRSRVILDALENANAIITRSGKLASLIKGMSHSINNVYPIYNGVNQNIFKFSPSDKSIEKCKNNINQLFLLYVGNFYKVKNPELLIRALSLIIKDYPDIKIKLNMIGEGYLLERMRNLVANLALQEHVHLLGRKTSQEIANYMQISDLLCIPSFNEGLPNVLLESLSCGLPVVSTNVGGISEVLSETRYGSLVNSFEPRNFADAIIQRLRLTEDPTKIINYAQRFSWDTTVQSHIKVFNDVIDAE